MTDQPSTSFIRPILLVLSCVLVLVALMTLPADVLSMGEGGGTLRAFLFTGAVCTLLAALGFSLCLGASFRVSSQQLYLITVGSWSLFALADAVPLYLALPKISFTDAFFESMSGITTTGSTILVGLDSMPHSILLWRGMLQWVGGIGIIVLGIAVLPFLRVGGMRLFATESSDWSSKSLPRAQAVIRNIGIVYIVLTLLAAGGYYLAGMGPFDAVVHSMSTVSTGGYSNYDASMGYFDAHPAILWVSIVFMLLGSLPFALYVPMLKGRFRQLLTDSQVHGFMLFVFGVVLLFSIGLSIEEDESIFLALTQVTFNVISVVTTTGYVSEDYTLWGPYALVLFFYLMFVGGCSGSTAGSIKIFRFQISLVLLRNQLHLMRHPNAIFTTKYNGRPVTDEIIRSIITFSFYFAFTIALLTLGLSLTGLDFVTSLSASTTAVANVGPGLGNVVGPSGNFSSLPDVAKWMLCIGMLVGRLEIMTVVVLFSRAFWKV